MSKTLWGIDLGGTKIEGVILSSLSDPKPLIRKRIETGGEKGYDHVLSQIKVLVDNLSAETGLRPDRIGFGTPGVLDPV